MWKNIEIDLQSLKTLEDVNDLFDYISKMEPGLAMVSGYRTRNSFINRIKATQISVDPFCSLAQDDQSMLLENYYATETYAQMVSMFYQWQQSGYLPDSLFLQDLNASALVKAGLLFSYFSAYKPNIEYEESLNCGQEMVTIPLMEPMVTSFSLSLTARWGINSTCKNPQKAMQLLDLLYTDADLINLLSYGIENIHYVIQPDGTISYPDGVTAENCGYQNTQAWILPKSVSFFRMVRK